MELAFYNIRVNGLAASITNKNFEATSSADTSGRATEKTLFMTPHDLPFKMHKQTIHDLDTAVEEKIVESIDVADALCWLASDEASFITGEITKVDAGYGLTSSNYASYGMQNNNRGQGH